MATLLAGLGLGGLMVVEFGLRLAQDDSSFRLWSPGLQATFEPTPRLMPGVEGPSRFSISAQGFRGSDRPAGPVLGLLALGGSTTECLYLDQTEAWPAELEGGLGGCTGATIWVANAGKSGRNLRDHVMQLEQLLPQHPEFAVVLLLAGINDLTLRLSLDEHYDPEFLSTPLGRQRQLLRAFDVRPLAQEPGGPHRRTALWRLAKRIKLRVQGSDQVQDPTGEVYAHWREQRAGARHWRDELPDLSSALGEFRGHLARCADLADAAGVTLVLCTQPAIWNGLPEELPPEVERLLWLGGAGDFMGGPSDTYYRTGAMRRGLEAYNECLREFAERRGLALVDLARELQGGTRHFYDEVHFNEAGAREVARRLTDFLCALPAIRGR